MAISRTPLFLFVSWHLLTVLISELGSPWDADLSLDEALVAGCAAYQALDRYLGGADIFILPRSRTELESIL